MKNSVPTNGVFQNVERGQLPSASNENALRDAVRELQRYFTQNHSARFALGRVDSSDFSSNRPNFNDDPIGTAIVDLGLAWLQSLETDDYEEYTVQNTQADLRQSVLNVGQRFFSRDEIFGLLQSGSKAVPIQLGGAQKVIAKTVTAVDGATIGIDEVTPGFGLADIYDWNADSTKLVKVEQQVRVANYVVDIIASGQFINASIIGKNYVVDPQTAYVIGLSLERFVMTSNWYGGIASATFTNLSEPSIAVGPGIVEDPLGIFTDILGVGGQGLSLRTRFGRHYVIQAKCNQSTVPPVDPVGKCELYSEESGLQCFVTTAAVCSLLGGTYGGNGTTCS